ncbi:hypothetical protein KGF54_000163 [Candida jiufengensis]|uniref:uncharacterized protein n=1 Tax=Candida jiufengensis TaxID=497108 RepID=UPI00222539D2|nr:uncharacterized protein KGF54_000163 [Candida jiufengensis]KAI5957235.1 hypothetical protein KGF54_000163 [Candida jiufengensis]
MSKSAEKLDSIHTDESFNSSLSDEFNYQKRAPRFIKWIYQLDNFGIETRGIERVSAEERSAKAKSTSTTYQLIQVIGLWFAACGGLTSMSSFFLPTLLFNLNLKNSLVSGIIAMLIGCLVPAYSSTMGPKSGCRQMVTARFLFGTYGVVVVSLLAITGGVGWSIVNCVLGGQMLVAINSNISLAVGIVVIAVVSLVVAVFGIKVLLKFQTILAIPIFIACILFYVVVCNKIGYVHDSNEIVNQLGLDSLTIRGTWLSFWTIAYSSTSSWASGASDYYILFPENTPSGTVFMVTFFGIAIPTTFVAVIGTICGNIALSYKPWNDAYTNMGVGGLIVETFQPWGKFGKFVAVLLYLSLICNNIMNTYSIAFEFQLIDKHLVFVPRWIWATIVSAIYIVLSLVGRDKFSEILSNLLPMLGYWISMYIVLLLEENLLFRSTIKIKKLHEKEFDDDDMDKLYNWKNWNVPKGRTLGIACCISFCCGVAGAVLGMNQVYFIGPLAKLIGSQGGDIGIWLAAGFTGITYPSLRYLELKYFKR